MPPHVTDRWSEYLGPGAVSSLIVSIVACILGLGLPVLWRLRQVVAAARWDEPGPADAILVLGRVLESDRPSRVFVARLEHGARLYERGLAPVVVVTGGLTGDATRTEAAAGREVLESCGVPAEAILEEGASRHTLENLFNVRETVRARGWERLLLVSDPLHQARVLAFAAGLKLDLACAPAHDAAPKGLVYWPRALREALLLHWYKTGAWWSRLVGAEESLARIT